MCHVSHVMYHISCVTCDKDKELKLFCGGSVIKGGPDPSIFLERAQLYLYLYMNVKECFKVYLGR